MAKEYYCQDCKVFAAEDCWCRELTEEEVHKVHDFLRSVLRYDLHTAAWYPKTTLRYIRHLEKVNAQLKESRDRWRDIAKS